MSTKPLPHGSRNVTINMPAVDQIQLVRAAGNMGYSMGAYARRCIRVAKFVWASGKLAARAEQADLKALDLIETALRDGHATDADLPALREALVLIRQSAGYDHSITTSVADAAR